MTNDCYPCTSKRMIKSINKILNGQGGIAV